MRDEEAFVARSLLAFLGEESGAVVSDGDDPPDFLLHFGESSVGVEVTRLSQRTVQSDGALGNRLTEDSFALRLLEQLNSSICSLLPDGIGLFITLQMPVQNTDRFRKQLTTWIREIAGLAMLGARFERALDGVTTRIPVTPERASGRKIAGLIVNANLLRISDSTPACSYKTASVPRMRAALSYRDQFGLRY
jgi:hypothetical protein